MKKAILILLALLIISSCRVITAGAIDQMLVYDEADLLSDEEESELLSRLEQLSSKYKMDIAVVTVDSTSDKTPMEFADDFYDYNGYGYGEEHDGLLLLISMEYSDWWISTCGKAINVFTDAGIEYIGERITYYLSDGDYAGAFNEFAVLCDAFIIQAETGDPYDSHNLPKEPFNILMALGIALVVGLIVAYIHVGKLKDQLKTANKKAEASAYVKAGSMNVSDCRDLFLYRTVTRTARETESSRGGSSTHTSSSGSSHGGGGGKF